MPRGITVMSTGLRARGQGIRRHCASLSVAVLRRLRTVAARGSTGNELAEQAPGSNRRPWTKANGRPVWSNRRKGDAGEIETGTA